MVMVGHQLLGNGGASSIMAMVGVQNDVNCWSSTMMSMFGHQLQCQWNINYWGNGLKSTI